MVRLVYHDKRVRPSRQGSSYYQDLSTYFRLSNWTVLMAHIKTMWLKTDNIYLYLSNELSFERLYLLIWNSNENNAFFLTYMTVLPH